MVLLCNLLSYLVDNPLIIVASISFIGVMIAAALSYWSNIKTNNAKIRIEEAKLNHTFTKECFDALVRVFKILTSYSGNIIEMEQGETKESMSKRILEFIGTTYDAYESILPFIEYDKIRAVEEERIKIFPEMSKWCKMMSQGKELSKEESDHLLSVLTASKIVSDKHIDIIKTEVIELGEKLRSFKID